MLGYPFLRKRNSTECTAWLQGTLHISWCYRETKLFHRLQTEDISDEI